jgi:YidC/Oxa1 family membrane protein insertase
MDRNTILGFVMMIALLVVYFLIFKPDEVPANPNATSTGDSTLVIKDEAPDTATAQLSAAPSDTLADSLKTSLENEILRREFGSLYPGARGEEKEIVLSNGKLSVTFNTKGGMPVAAVLNDGHVTYWDSIPVELWDKNSSEMSFILRRQGKDSLFTSDLFFQPSLLNAEATGTEPAKLDMKLVGADGAGELIFKFSLLPDSYELKMDMEVKGFDNEIIKEQNKLSFQWGASGKRLEKGIDNERQHSSVFFKPVDDDRDYLSEARDDEETTEVGVNWVAFKQNFFSAAVINPEAFGAGSYLLSAPPGEGDTTVTMRYFAKLPMNVSDGNASLRFYFGPNEFRSLKAMEVEELPRIIDYGWGIFGWVNKHMIRPVFVFFSGFNLNYGIVILIVTILIKLLLFPVTWKNYLSSAKMRVLKPEIDEINKKFEGKDAAMEKQQAVMALYRQTGVNPLAGCIPVLLQMPILYAMFRFFPASIELRQESFLWADDLGAYDVLFYLPFNIPLYGAHVSGFTVLMAISTFIYTRMSTASMPDTTQPGMPNMKIIMNIFPFMMLFFFNSMPAGLSFYYFAANVVSIGQMWFIKEYIIDEGKIREKIEDNKKKPKKVSGFQQRLAEMQKAQQEKMKQAKTKK